MAIIIHTVSGAGHIFESDVFLVQRHLWLTSRRWPLLCTQSHQMHVTSQMSFYRGTIRCSTETNPIYGAWVNFGTFYFFIETAGNRTRVILVEVHCVHR